jgi:hypothetical protein
LKQSEMVRLYSCGLVSPYIRDAQATVWFLLKWSNFEIDIEAVKR